jgi:hypothetical protein
VLLLALVVCARMPLTLEEMLPEVDRTAEENVLLLCGAEEKSEDESLLSIDKVADIKTRSVLLASGIDPGLALPEGEKGTALADINQLRRVKRREGEAQPRMTSPKTPRSSACFSALAGTCLYSQVQVQVQFQRGANGECLHMTWAEFIGSTLHAYG